MSVNSVYEEERPDKSISYLNRGRRGKSGWRNECFFSWTTVNKENVVVNLFACQDSDFSPGITRCLITWKNMIICFCSVWLCSQLSIIIQTGTIQFPEFCGNFEEKTWVAKGLEFVACTLWNMCLIPGKVRICIYRKLNKKSFLAHCVATALAEWSKYLPATLANGTMQ